jgi:hypothetical protein
MPELVQKPSARTPDDLDGAAAVMAKVERLLAERSKLKEGMRANSTALQNAVTAGRFFGIDVPLPDDILLSPPLTPLRRERVHLKEDTLFEPTADVSVREVVIAELLAAGPKGARAALIRQKVEAATGRKLHYKTIGMTLYRLSEKGLVRRNGLTWFGVPKGT